MPLNSIVYKKVTDTIQSVYPEEIKFYTDSDVQVTPHAVGLASSDNWTDLFYRDHIIDTHPEGKRFIELERTLTALYNLFLVLYLDLDTGYDLFIQAQKENRSEIKETDILTKSQFKELYDTLRTFCQDADKQTVLMYLIIYSDLGKAPRIKNQVAELAEKKGLKMDPLMDSDDFMAAFLKAFSDEEISTILPSFAKLTQDAKSFLKKCYPLMQACFGHVYFLERGVRTFEIILEALEALPIEEHQEALKIVYLAQLLDGIAAQAQRIILGSITCTGPFYQGYRRGYDALEYMRKVYAISKNKTHSSQIGFDYYLIIRSQWLGFEDIVNSKQQEFLTRLGCNLRGFTPVFGDLIREEFNKLNKDDRELLVDELSFSNKGFEAWTKVNYFATIPQNSSRKLFAENKPREAIHAALNSLICFCKIVEKVQKETSFVFDRTRSISFGEIAYLVGQYPGLFEAATFDAADYAFNPLNNKIIKKTSIEMKPQKKESKCETLRTQVAKWYHLFYKEVMSKVDERENLNQKKYKISS